MIEHRRPARRLRTTLIATWSAFWLLMLAVGIQEYLREGGRQLWEPVLDYTTAAAVTSVIAWLQLRHARRLDPWLDRPLQWFARLWIRLPLAVPSYIAALYGIRHGVRALFGEPYRHAPWGETIRYESIKFLIFYGLFSGLHFGVRSYLAWVAERLHAERQEALAREAQLAQLTQQLQPHFLFNALNTISSLIHTAPDQADALLTRLATLLRAATDAGGRPEHSLADELSLLEAYAQIMLQRFGDRARIEWRIDAEARHCRVPTMGLQPLLENCFRHVVEKRRGPTQIVVRASRHSAHLCLEIEDDGEARAEPLRHGVGLGNLQRRLAARHGNDASLELVQRDGGGLIVRVTLPCAS